MCIVGDHLEVERICINLNIFLGRFIFKTLNKAFSFFSFSFAFDLMTSPKDFNDFNWRKDEMTETKKNRLDSKVKAFLP